MPNGAELTGWFEYLRMEDEARANWMTYSIVRAFKGDKDQQKRQTNFDDEELIDTTRPEFAESFQGFINNPVKKNTFQERNTEIFTG